MDQEKTKKTLLIIFVTLILGIVVWAIISNTYFPIKNLRSNTIEEKEEANIYDDNITSAENIESNNLLDDIDITIDQSTDNDYIEASPIETEIAKYSTTIYDKEEERIHNIKLATSKLDGTIIEAGAEFSFNDTIGPMGKEQGYQKATGFNGNGKKIKIYGGGMCQISSTLYNAALIANFDITERHAHSRRVYYVPKDKDATVSYGGADLKFKNNKDIKVKISASTDGHDVTIKLLEIT